MPPTPALDALRVALQSVSTTTRAPNTFELDQLRRRVCDAVEELRHYGLPAERVVVVIKQLAADAGFGRHNDASREQLVSWCIDQYYARSGEDRTAEQE